MKVIHLISMSGGKDSLATRLVAIEKGIEHIAVFADTGNEHQITYDYLDYLREVTGPIETVKADFTRLFKVKQLTIATKWVKDGVPAETRKRAIKMLEKPTGNPFLDLCLYKTRFPSTRAAFCSQSLKQEPINDYISTLEYDRLWSWQGVRADESRNRRFLPQIEKLADDFLIVRPILEWNYKQVFNIAKRHGIKPNPLYKMGFSRVGCFPCINERKEEVRLIAENFPEEINRVREWERMVGQVSKRLKGTFFPYSKTPTAECGGIDDVVEWSKTSRGGRQYKMFQPPIRECSSIYGLCE